MPQHPPASVRQFHWIFSLSPPPPPLSLLCARLILFYSLNEISDAQKYLIQKLVPVTITIITRTPPNTMPIQMIYTNRISSSINHIDRQKWRTSRYRTTMIYSVRPKNMTIRIHKMCTWNRQKHQMTTVSMAMATATITIIIIITNTMRTLIIMRIMHVIIMYRYLATVLVALAVSEAAVAAAAAAVPTIMAITPL